MLKTLDQSLKVLQFFTKNKPSWGARELAKEGGLNRATIYRILSTFESNRFLVKDVVTKNYSLGIRLWDLGLVMYDSLSLSKLVRPILEELMINTGESVFLTGLEGEDGLTLEAMEPDNKVTYSVSVGSRVPLYAGASYRAILAFMDRDIIKQVLSSPLNSYTSATLTNHKKILKKLELIRENGWAQSEGEYTKDVVAIAVPLFYNHQDVVGSLTVAGPTYRLTENDIEKNLIYLKEARNKIEIVLQEHQLNLKMYFKV